MVPALRFAACLAALWALPALAPGRAHAGPAAGAKTSKVTIETDPPGAKVYFGLKEDGEVCTTPCTVDAPIGETPIIVEAENRRSIIENLIVPKKSARPIKVVYRLEPAIGSVVFEGGAGASIKIDDEDKGKAGRVDGVLAGAHHVVIERNGKTLYDGFVEVEAGHEAMVAGAASAGAASRPSNPAPTGGSSSSGGGGATIDVGVEAKQAEPAHDNPTVAVFGAMDVGFRQFKYQHNLTPETQRDDRESGQVLAGPVVELWPTTLLGVDALNGLALYGRFEFGLNSQAVSEGLAGGGSTRSSLSTEWRSIELSGKQRWMLADVATLEVGAGFVQDRYQFKGMTSDINNVPDALYNAVRIGGRASLLLGLLEPFFSAENRIVLSGGVMDHRYTLGSSTSGYRVAAGAALTYGHIRASVEGGFDRYNWTFKADNGDPGQATGGTDSIEDVAIAIGYTY